MNNLVTIKQAEDLKSLGYDEKCFRYAYKFDNKFILQKNLIKVSNKNRTSPLILAIPTVDEAIDWLRRKYKLYVHIEGKDEYDEYNVLLSKNWDLDNIQCAKNIYAAKRLAISSIIREIKKRTKNVAKRRKSKN